MGGTGLRCLLLGAALLWIGGVSVHGQELPPRIWDVHLGSPLTALGVDFVEPACGTNGGPPGRVLSDFVHFNQCPTEPDRLREIWFRYDDTREYMARAYRNPVAVAQNLATSISGQPTIFSFLVDEGGRIRGYRIFTDPRADERVRFEAHLLSATLRARFGTGWACNNRAPAPGETPIQGTYVNQHCTVSTEAADAVLETRFFFKDGQDVVDAATGKPMVNAFESAAFLEVREPRPFVDVAARLAAPDAADAAQSREARFLVGLSSDCPGCNLAGADLRRRDLTDADLSGANLEGAVLHRAILSGANLSMANLDKAVLNLTDLNLANFAGASLAGALLFHAQGSRPDFSHADLSGVRMGEASLRQPVFEGATLDKADLGGASLNDGRFAGASLLGAYLYQASLLRADLTDVRGEGANFVSARMHRANLNRAHLKDADFQDADLGEADLSNADLTHVRFQFANLRGANREGAVFTGSLMPEGSTAP